MKHELKTAPEFFQAAWVGDKTFEIRDNDRKFKERDEVVFKEYGSKPDDPLKVECYSGRKIEGVIVYLTNFMQQPGYVVFSYRVTGRIER